MAMNNEPVAWIIDANMTDCDDNFIWNTGGYPDWQVKDWIPLYTHPAKTLTISIVDIDNVVDQFWYSDDAGFHFHYYEFAEAILRKAQEK